MAEKRKTRKIAVRKNGHVLVKASNFKTNSMCDNVRILNYYLFIICFVY